MGHAGKNTWRDILFVVVLMRSKRRREKTRRRVLFLALLPYIASHFQVTCGQSLILLIFCPPVFPLCFTIHLTPVFISSLRS